VDFQEGTGRRLADGCQALAQFAGGMIIAFVKSWKLSLVLLCSFPIMGGAMASLTKVLADAKNKTSGQYAEAGAIANEALSSIRTVASLCAGEAFILY